MRALKSIEEAAGLLGISPWTIRSYIRDGKLKPVRLGRRVLLEEDELERLVADSQKPESVRTEKVYETNKEARQ
jgi:excisionase family DNA binding protein